MGQSCPKNPKKWNEIKHSGLVGWCRFTKMSLKDLFRPCLLFTELFELEETVGVSAVDSVTFKTHTAVFSFEESLSVAVLSVSQVWRRLTVIGPSFSAATRSTSTRSC